MKKISFCTTCKGRLWQLEQTLEKNLKVMDDDCEWVILDYQSPDGLKSFLETHYAEHLNSGRIKYFQLLNDYNFYCAYAKNVAHRLASGETLFNLDADGFITQSLIGELRALKDKEILVPRYNGNDEGSFGRLGYTRKSFMELNGYSENIIKMQDDDGNLRYRAMMAGFRPRHAKEVHLAIQNTPEQKELYTDVEGLTPPPNNWPRTWGAAQLKDREGNFFELV